MMKKTLILGLALLPILALMLVAVGGISPVTNSAYAIESGDRIAADTCNKDDKALTAIENDCRPLTAEEKAEAQKKTRNYSAKCEKVEGVYVGSDLAGDSHCLGSKEQNPIYKMIARFVQIFTGIFGLLLVGMIIYAGIEYITAQGSPDHVKSAKSHLEQAATGLVLFVLMFGILELIIPGGVFQ